MKKQLLIFHQNKLHETARKKERQDFIAMKRIHSLVPESPELLIPQYIKEGKVNQLIQIHSILVQLGPSEIAKELSRQYFMSEFKKTENNKLKAVILKLTKLINQWSEEQFQLAFELCQQHELLEDIIQYIEQQQGKVDENSNNNKLAETESDKLQNIEKNKQKHNKVYEILKSFQRNLEGQTILKYCYLLLHYSDPSEHSPQTVTLILSQVDIILQIAQLLAICLIILEKFLQSSCNLNQYSEIIKMKNFNLIVKECYNPDYTIHSMAYQILIDILPSNPEICQELINKYEFVKIIDKFLDHPFLSIKTLWAISNLVIIDTVMPHMMGIMHKLFERNSETYSGNIRILHQLSIIVINTLYTSTPEIIELIFPLLPHFMPFIQQILYTQFKNRDLHKNLIHAIARSLVVDKRMKSIYLKYGIGRKLEQFEKDHQKIETQVISGILDALMEMDEEKNQ